MVICVKKNFAGMLLNLFSDNFWRELETPKQRMVEFTSYSIDNSIWVRTVNLVKGILILI